jgi:hypothetical protein
MMRDGYVFGLGPYAISAVRTEFNRRAVVSQETTDTDRRTIPPLSIFYSVITLNDGVIEPAGGTEPLSFPADRTKQ